MFTILHALFLTLLFLLKGAALLGRWTFRMALRGIRALRHRNRPRESGETRLRLVYELQDLELHRAWASERKARHTLAQGDIGAAIGWRKRQLAHLDAARGYGRWLRKLSQAA